MKESNDRIPSGWGRGEIKNEAGKPGQDPVADFLSRLPENNEFTEAEKADIAELLQSHEGEHLLKDLPKDDPLASVERGEDEGSYVFKTVSGIYFKFAPLPHGNHSF